MRQHRNGASALDIAAGLGAILSATSGLALRCLHGSSPWHMLNVAQTLQ